MNGPEKHNLQVRGTCALCLKNSHLRNSHIIPEFLYRSLYDEKHRFNTYGLNGNAKVITEQKGTRQRLLCDTCEQQFSSYERVASDFFNGTLKAFENQSHSEIPYVNGFKFSRIAVEGEVANLTSAAVPTLISVEGINYTTLKLFMLSLIWRMGISTLHYFREVELGPHTERLRLMLLNEQPGEPDEYPCQMNLVEAYGRLMTDLQSQPRRMKLNGLTHYRFFNTGFRFDFCVSNQRLHPGWIELSCLKNEPKFVWWVSSIHKNPDLVAEIVKLGYDLNWDK